MGALGEQSAKRWHMTESSKLSHSVLTHNPFTQSSCSFSTLITMSGKFEPKTPVNLDPPKDDPISPEELAAADGMAMSPRHDEEPSTSLNPLKMLNLS